MRSSGDDNRPLNYKVRTHTIGYAQDGIVSRLEKDRGAVLEQTERVLLVTSEALQIQDRERLHYKLLGTTRGNTLGPVGLPPWTDTDMAWNQSWSVKTDPRHRWQDPRWWPM